MTPRRMVADRHEGDFMIPPLQKTDHPRGQATVQEHAGASNASRRVKNCQGRMCGITLYSGGPCPAAVQGMKFSPSGSGGTIGTSKSGPGAVRVDRSSTPSVAKKTAICCCAPSANAAAAGVAMPGQERVRVLRHGRVGREGQVVAEVGGAVGQVAGAQDGAWWSGWAPSGRPWRTGRSPTWPGCRASGDLRM